MKYIQYNSRLITDLIDEWSHGLPDSSLTQAELYQMVKEDLESSLSWEEHPTAAVAMSISYLTNIVTREVLKRNKKYLEKYYGNRKDI